MTETDTVPAVDRTMAYQYDKAGNRTRVTRPGGFYVVYDDDAAGRPTAVRESGATSGVQVLAGFATDAPGQSDPG